MTIFPVLCNTRCSWFYMQLLVSFNLPTWPSLLPSPQGFSVPVSLFLFLLLSLIFCIFLKIPHISYTICLSMSYFTTYNTLQVHPRSCKCQEFHLFCVFHVSRVIHSSAEGCVDRFRVSTTTQCCCEHWVHLSFGITAFIFFGRFPTSGISGPHDSSVLIFLRSLHTAAPVYIPTIGAQRFPLLHSLPNLNYLCFFWWWDNISLWFWFAFLWWLLMLSIFSCVCWPSTGVFFGRQLCSPLYHQRCSGVLFGKMST